MTKVENWIKAIERGFVFLAGLGLLTVMIVIVIDVVLRYFFSAPLSWSYDLVSLYLITLVFFMALADTFRRGDHIKVDLFERLRGTRLLAITEIIGYCLALVFFGLILQQMVASGWEAFSANDVLDGAIPWPTWPPYAVGALGVGLLILRLLLNTFGRLSALLAGRSYVQEGADRPDRHAAGNAE
jgi:TRAP-type C4-dicarboxylate transport system permease small subunit